MPTENGATDLLGATALLTERMQEERKTPTGEQGSETKPEAKEADPKTPEGGDKPEEQPKYKVKVDGEELEVPLDELQKGYMMESSYRKKTMALGKDREAMEAKAGEVDKQLEDARAIIEDGISNLESPEMRELRERDPEAYLKKEEKIRGKIKRFEDLRTKRAKDHQTKRENLVKKEYEALVDMFPAWKDQEVMNKEGKELLTTLKTFGYSDTDLSSITDHKMFLVADKLRDLTAKATELEELKKINLDGKIVKPESKSSKPGTGGEGNRGATEETKQMRSKLKKTGSLDDAMQLLSM